MENQSASSISNKHVLVIGGAGYLGSVLVRKLLKLRYTVTVYDNLLYGDNAIKELERDDFFAVIEGDVRDHEKLRKIMPGKNILINLAAIVGDEACEIDPQASKEINAGANNHLFKIAEEFGLERYVFASTCSVYGFADVTLKEDSFLNPVSLYAQTKLASELFLLSLAQRSGVALTILRFATLFGWSHRPRFDLVVNTMTTSAITRNKVYIYGGNQWRPHLHLIDAADAIVRTLEAPVDLIRGAIFNVGANHLNMTIEVLGRKVASTIPGCSLEIKANGNDHRNYKVDFTKIARILDFKPRYDIYDGIRELYSNFIKGRVPNVNDPVYSNVKFLSKQADTPAADRISEKVPCAQAQRPLELSK